MIKRVSDTFFVPIVVPVLSETVASSLYSTLAIETLPPHVIFLSRKPYESNEIIGHLITPHFIHIKSKGVPKNADFYKFKEIVMEIVLSPQFKENSTVIGIASRNTIDLCGFFIVRWLIDEKGIPAPTAINYFRSLSPNGLSKPKYVEYFQQNYPFSKALEISQHIDDVSMQSHSTTEIGNAKRPDIAKSLKIFQTIGKPIEPKQIGIYIAKINIQFDILETKLPFSNLVPITYSIASGSKNELLSTSILHYPEGVRAFLFCIDNGFYLINEKNEGRSIVLKSYEEFIHTQSSTVIEGFIIDGETKPTFMILDAFCINGNHLTKLSYSDRYGLIMENITQKKNPSLNNSDDLTLELISLIPLTGLIENMAKIQHGLLFMENSPINLEKRYRGFEWIIPRKLPIVLMKIKKPEMECEGYVSQRGNLVSMISLGIAKPETHSLDNNCVEVSFNDTTKQWKIVQKVDSQTPWTMNKFRLACPVDEPYISTNTLSTLLKVLLANNE